MVNSLFDIQGQTAVITGGSGVLGSAMAHGLAGAGATVVVIGLHGEKTRAVVEAISAQGGQALAIACNVLERADLQHALEKVTATFGPVDILVNGGRGQCSTGHYIGKQSLFRVGQGGYRWCICAELYRHVVELPGIWTRDGGTRPGLHRECCLDECAAAIDAHTRI
jgi:NAD(P)-dependent dehydrogenase (short-subunit alcohol dehydrogenase family)